MFNADVPFSHDNRKQAVRKPLAFYESGRWNSLSNTETTHILIIFNLQSFAQRTRQFSSRLNVRYSYNSGTEYIAIAKMYDGLIRHYKTMKPIKKTECEYVRVCCEFIQFGSILGNEHHQAQTGRRSGIRKCVSLNSRNGLKLC